MNEAQSATTRRSGSPGSKPWAPITRKKSLLPAALPGPPSSPDRPGSVAGRSACSLFFTQQQNFSCFFDDKQLLFTDVR